MNIKWRKRAGLVSAIGFMVLLLIMGLQPVAAQDKGEYPGESPAAPVPGDGASRRQAHCQLRR